MIPSTSTPEACPRCGRGLERRRRTALDRLRTLFTSRVRYGCAAHCGWEGLMPRIARDFGRSRYVLDSAREAPKALGRRYTSH